VAIERENPKISNTNRIPQVAIISSFRRGRFIALALIGWAGMSGCQDEAEKPQEWRKVKATLSRYEGIEGHKLGKEGFVVDRLRRGDRQLLGKPRSRIPMSHQGYALMDLETGKILQSHRMEKSFVPASTIKLFTAVAALSILGPDHRFKTTLAYDGRIEGEVLKGDLYLKGEGDPFLTAAHLMTFVESLRRLGVKRVDGQFILDESKFAVRESLVGEEMVGVPYNMGVGPLSVEFNQFKVAWRKKKGFRIHSVPDLDLFHFGRAASRFESETGFKQSNGNYDGHQYWLIDPRRASRAGRTRLPSKQPGVFTAEFFRELCAIAGILVPHSESGIMNSATVRIVKQHSGKRVVELVESVFEYSNNLIAELLLLGAAAELTRKRVTSVGRSGSSNQRVVGQQRSNREELVRFRARTRLRIDGG
jgi:D-alanyl-D-alanine carboxypeptidase